MRTASLSLSSLGTFIYDVCTEGEEFSPKTDDNTHGLHDSESDKGEGV